MQREDSNKQVLVHLVFDVVVEVLLLSLFFTFWFYPEFWVLLHLCLSYRQYYKLYLLYGQATQNGCSLVLCTSPAGAVPPTPYSQERACPLPQLVIVLIIRPE